MLKKIDAAQADEEVRKRSEQVIKDEANAKAYAGIKRTAFTRFSN